jgi:RimJ/RimL family protein N-acetyltransferase
MSRLDDDWPRLSDGVVVLRVLRPDDVAAWKAGEDAEQIRWFEATGPAPLENISVAIGAWRGSWRDDGDVRHWGIEFHDELAGGVELRKRHDGRCSISYVVFPTARRQAVATRAVRLASQWAFDRFAATAVAAIIDENNNASRAVAVSAGFVPDGLAEPWEHSESGVMLRYLLAARRAH